MTLEAWMERMEDLLKRLKRVQKAKERARALPNVMGITLYCCGEKSVTSQDLTLPEGEGVRSAVLIALDCTEDHLIMLVNDLRAEKVNIND